jgi:hypothetical protein
MLINSPQKAKQTKKVNKKHTHTHHKPHFDHQKEKKKREPANKAPIDTSPKEHSENSE